MSARSLAVRGLFQDSTLQVLDNKVFRVLVALALLPIILTFVVGLHEHSFSFLFGLWEIDYPEWITMLGPDPRGAMLEMFIDAIIVSFAGMGGLTVSVAATAFFVPRMLEKGSADLVFTKPISRSVLYISRYFTGLLFIALLGGFMTFGTYLGVLLASGVNYPAILWSTITLVYIFALIHGVTMLIGALTKSTPAAMILGIMFFFGNGCVHQGWQVADAFTSEENPMSAVIADSTDEGSSWDTVMDVALATLNTVHYILPKTSDASLVVMQTQDALFGSNRAATRKELQSTITERQQKERAERKAKRGDEPQEDFSPDPDAWFENHFAWDAPELRYNIWFSILSSLLFTTVILGLGCWRIRRMDF
jgi:ABC-type transport system involved in multi-copper enzyme maturation permease subunit